MWSDGGQLLVGQNNTGGRSTWVAIRKALVALILMVGQAEQVVTGDAVVLDVQIAQLPVRALSTLIDVAVIFIGYIDSA